MAIVLICSLIKVSEGHRESSRSWLYAGKAPRRREQLLAVSWYQFPSSFRQLVNLNSVLDTLQSIPSLRNMPSSANKLSGVFVNGPSVSQVGWDLTELLHRRTGQRSAFGACNRDAKPHSGHTLKIKLWAHLEGLFPDVWRFLSSLLCGFQKNLKKTDNYKKNSYSTKES